MDDHKILASSENYGTVSLCAGGVVHVNLTHLTLRLIPSDFEKLADLIIQARANYQAVSRTKDEKPRLRVVSEKKDDQPENPQQP
ncbi:MAG: hypothetical protein AB1646_21170 [Thermodesulfobacteriota bacterium]